MFRKLISNLPFNPSLLNQVAFYAQRVKQEESLRRIGFVFIALTLIVQSFAVIAPPEKSLAYSNDYIVNGLRTRDDILRAWDGQTTDKNVAAIYGRFGLTRDDIAALPLQPNSTVRSTDANYWTIGRTSLSAVSKAPQIKQVYKDSEVPVNYGAGNVYLRQLKAWDIRYSSNSYKAFQGTKNGKPFWILVDCGNFTQVGQPPLNQPALQFRKTIDGGARSLKPGDNFSFRFEYRNQVAESQPAENVVLEDTLELDKFDIVSPSNLPLQGNKLVYPLGTVGYSDTFRTAIVINVRLKANLDNGVRACNAATLKASNAAEVGSGGQGLCITVINPCPLDTSLSNNDPRCISPVVACSLSVYDVNKTTKEFTLKTAVTSSNSGLTTIKSYLYDFGDGSNTVTRRSAAYTDTIAHIYKDGAYTATVEVSYLVGQGSGQKDGSTVCSAPIDSQPDQPLSQNKTARNLTQNIDMGNTTAKAKAGDTIEYSLITHNSYDYDRANVVVSDYIGDILDYASIDQAFLSQQGAKYDEQTRTINWQGTTVLGNSNMTKLFRVQMKNPIPATNQPSAITTSFDCKISNKFGDQIDILVDCPLVKSSEYLTSTLPKTGPGSSLVIGFVVTTVAGYFFARSRVLAQELDIIRSDFVATGGV